MAQLHVTIEVAGPDGARWDQVEVLVDIGSTYTKVPTDLLARPGATPTSRRRAVIANGETIERQLGIALIHLNGEQLPNVVTFGRPGETPLLGSVTLENFSLGVDPINKRLIPIDALELTT